MQEVLWSITALRESEKGWGGKYERRIILILGEFRGLFVFNSKFLLYICSL